MSDLEWPFHGLSVPSVWERRALKELNANVNALCTSTLKSTSSASRAISAAAELLVTAFLIVPSNTRYYGGDEMDRPHME